ncbi:hypothetical protein ACFP81_04045 [Deinococcus lacus]|uniref:Uncharacterized protein n=1 Tax=Deinococcus lacus TaxID=392561 RepID=A0ABW1YCY9_9DEIO
MRLRPLLLAALLSGSAALAQPLSLSPQVKQARFSVLIPEEIIRRPVPDPAVETEVMRALTAQGFRVVDAGQQQRNAQRALLRGVDPSSIPDLSARLNADYLVTGEAFAEEFGTVAGGMRGYTARLELKVIDLASGQVTYSQAFQGSGVGATDAVAGKTALMNLGKAAGQQLPAALNAALSGQSQVAARTFVVRVQPPATFSQVNVLSQRLGAAGASEVMVRAVDSGGAVLDVSFGGSPADLAGQLEKLGLTVVGLTGQEITARF